LSEVLEANATDCREEVTLTQDVQRIRPTRRPPGYTIYGFVDDLRSGKLIEVPAAAKAGKILA
jgi:hypothetical protein